jgi:hypothetical protein
VKVVTEAVAQALEVVTEVRELALVMEDVDGLSSPK